MLLSQRLLFLGGKGGVGKTTLAAALALGLAEQGERVLLLSTDPAHSLSDLLDRPLSDRATRVADGLYARELDPEQARDAYLDQVRANIRQFTQPEFLQEAERQITLAGQHPGVMESALFEALCRSMDELDQWDRVIVDTAPTGHTLHLLGLPESMSAWTRALMQRQGGNRQADPQVTARWEKARAVMEARQALFERVRDRLQDAETTVFLLVVNDDRLSVLEGARARKSLTEAGVSVPLCLVNRSEADWPASAPAIESRLGGLPLYGFTRQSVYPQGLSGLRPLADIFSRQGLI
ncbi:arsenite-transporting ATPase [Natronospira proteinivora]|uniref:arsenite-transporting ATPase n=1 Tax=Natronospira proteinivora TaxID=1807133 RepID=A0ABT1G4Q2_9GAMM|nr:TRC40/GET3/ArsA family transport-energizing ATPase [Natronospira proteinivora]MCP1726279.1 arsenite-transporting ATPase [Natronospira proteinivora]